jgi:hypothetical protein
MGAHRWRIVVGAFTVALCASALSCSRQILEARDVANFRVVETNSPSAPTLKLSGLAMHSAMTVGDIVVDTKADSAAVLVHMKSPPVSTASGSFEFVYPVPDHIKVVYFGMDGTPVWRRGAGPLVPTQADGGRR